MKTSGADAGGPAAKVPAQSKFTTTTVDGKAFAGTSPAGKDAVLWFWAPWCAVCRGEAPPSPRPRGSGATRPSSECSDRHPQHRRLRPVIAGRPGGLGRSGA
ncbi:hypothetical protein CLM62_26490 [Streptomyces sp. SA15]|nr:hypothetical protein CLM62_26490 [Streptomyces sp. SA15]